MEENEELDEFRRFQIASKIDRAEGLIAQYRENISFYRQRIDVYHRLMGHIGARLGEPQPEEP